MAVGVGGRTDSTSPCSAGEGAGLRQPRALLRGPGLSIDKEKALAHTGQRAKAFPGLVAAANIFGQVLLGGCVVKADVWVVEETVKLT